MALSVKMTPVCFKTFLLSNILQRCCHLSRWSVLVFYFSKEIFKNDSISHLTKMFLIYFLIPRAEVHAGKLAKPPE